MFFTDEYFNIPIDFRWYKCAACELPVRGNSLRKVTYYKEDDATKEFNFICKACVVLAKDTPRCSDCGSTLREFNYKSIGGLCKNCHREFKEARYIRSYSSNALNLMSNPLHSSKLYIGMELEIECRDALDKANKVLDLVGRDFALAKEDGSVAGFELVTVPASIEEHKKRFKWLIEKRPSGLIGWSGNNNGIHLHVSKKVIGATNIAKIQYFVFKQSNHEFIYRVSGRKSEQWCDLPHITSIKQLLTPKQNVDASKSNVFYWWGEKYIGVNLCPANTIEFRLFRSTLNYNRLISNIEFVHSLITYLQQVKLTDEAAYDWASFVNWVLARKDKNTYKYFRQFLLDGKHINGDYKIQSDSDDGDADYCGNCDSSPCNCEDENWY